LESGRLGTEDRYSVIWSYEAALLMLGQRQRAAKIHHLLRHGGFAPRRAITALCVAGDKAGLDWLLWNPEVIPETAISLLVDQHLTQVLLATAPQLPSVDVPATDDVQRWQLRILQESYAIHRSRIELGLKE
jgi:hypothetical protein